MSPIGAIESSALAVALRESAWLFPAVKIVHLTGVALLICSIAVLDLRLLGSWRTKSVRQLAGRVLPWTLGSFFLIVPSGLMMFIAYATEVLQDPVFALKIGLILLGGTNAAVFHAGAFRGVSGWDVDALPPPAARAAGAISLATWFSVIVCGRLIA